MLRVETTPGERDREEREGEAALLSVKGGEDESSCRTSDNAGLRRSEFASRKHLASAKKKKLGKRGHVLIFDVTIKAEHVPKRRRRRRR